jgi:hypothetical protein
MKLKMGIEIPPAIQDDAVRNKSNNNAVDPILTESKISLFRTINAGPTAM